MHDKLIEVLRPGNGTVSREDRVTVAVSAAGSSVINAPFRFKSSSADPASTMHEQAE